MEDNSMNLKNDMMDGDDSRLLFGSYLKKARLAHGMSIEDVMDYTRISKFVVEQIEANNLSKLPEPVFLKGFLKTFAEAVGVDPADVLRRYNRVAETDAQQSEKTSGSQKVNRPVRHITYNRTETGGKSKKSSVTVWLVVLIIAAAVVAGFYYNRYRKLQEISDGNRISMSEVTGTEDNASVETGTSDAGAATGSVDEAVQKSGDTEAKEVFQLEMVCVERTTVKVSVDNGVPDVYKMKPGDNVRLAAKQMFNILIDDKCGVSLFLDNVPVVLPGKCGQSVNIQLP